MKEAQSMRYGGLFVAASECDYTSFKHQGLLCPICKKSVFLVAGSERSQHQRTLKNGSVTEVRQAKVDAYFAHHPDTEQASVQACELRSSQITQVQKELIAAKARGQRQKALQAHCWKILKTSLKLVDIDTTPKFLYALWKESSPWLEEKDAKQFYSTMISAMCNQFRKSAQLAHTKSTLGDAINIWFHQSQDEFLTVQTMKPLFGLWRSKLDRKMQEAITCEVLDFISQKRQTPILGALVEHSVYNFVASQAHLFMGFESDITDDERIKYLNKLNPSLELSNEMVEGMVQATQSLALPTEEVAEALFYFIRDDVVQSIVFTDWAGEFQRLENLELARR